jgi:hypothetical protein
MDQGDRELSAAKKIASKRRAKRAGIKVLRTARQPNTYPRKDGKTNES